MKGSDIQMKFYDKEIYQKDERIKAVLVVIVPFLIGFIIGCIAINMDLKNKNMDLEKQISEKQEYIDELEKRVDEQQVKINEQYVELDSLRETVYMYNLYGYGE